MKLSEPSKTHIIFIIAISMFMETLDASALNTSLPQIAYSLHSNPIALKVAITTYLLTLGIFIPVSGWLVDRIGERKTLLLSISLFLLSSIGCASAINVSMLVTFRLLQGVGGAFLAPVARLVLIRVYGKENIIKAMSKVSIISLSAIMLGPLLGGAITTFISWRWIFWINIPFGVIGIIEVLRYLPRLSKPSKRPFNIINFLLMGTTVGLLLFLVDTIIDPFMTPLEKASLFIIVILLTWLTIMHTKKSAHPLLDFSVFHNPTFSITALGSLISRFAISTPPFLIPLMLQASYGFSAFHAGLMAVPALIGALTSRKFIAPILNKLGYSCFLKANTFILWIIFSSYTINAWKLMIPVLLIQQFCFGFSSALQFTSMNSLAYRNLNDEQISRGSTIYSAIIQLSASFGIAIAALIMIATIGHENLTDHVPLATFKVVFFAQGIFIPIAIFFFSRLRHVN